MFLNHIHEHFAIIQLLKQRNCETNNRLNFFHSTLTYGKLFQSVQKLFRRVQEETKAFHSKIRAKEIK